MGAERDKLVWARRAFREGFLHAIDCYGGADLEEEIRCEQEMNQCYPLSVKSEELKWNHRPRLRQVKDSFITGWIWTCEQGVIHLRDANGKSLSTQVTPFSRRVRMWNDLLNNPTEKVDI